MVKRGESSRAEEGMRDLNAPSLNVFAEKSI
jgi:hypothetical protein